MSIKVTGIDEVNRILMEMAPNEANNLIRSTVQEIAVQLAKLGKANAPSETGSVKAGTKGKRRRGRPNFHRSTVEVSGAFHWRFLEYGQGPDGVEHAMFLRALMEIQPQITQVYLDSFTKKLVAKMARDAKRKG